jgi:hypothetical protein
MSAKIVNLSRRRARKLLPAEIAIYGSDAVVDPETGFVFETGLGAHPRRLQTALHKANLANPEWVAAYKLSDPHARIRHPELFEGDK